MSASRLLNLLGCSKFLNYLPLQEQLPVYHPIKSVKSDFYERPEFLSVTLYIKNIQSDCLKVDFSESRVLVNFRTR